MFKGIYNKYITKLNSTGRFGFAGKGPAGRQGSGKKTAGWTLRSRYPGKYFGRYPGRKPGRTPLRGLSLGNHAGLPCPALSGITRAVGRLRRLRLGDFILLMLPLLLLLILIPPPEKTATTDLGQVKAANESDIFITVYNPDESIIDEYPLESYVTGVLAAEMPAGFHEEALKAQAVAARTFALSRMQGLYGSADSHFGAHVCTDPAHCQAWVSKERFLEAYGDEAAWEKLKKAVEATENVVMTYSGTLINPLYHSNSGGVTENVEEVWSISGEVPYLKSVYSPDESKYTEFEKKTVFAWDEIKQKVKNKYPDANLGPDAEKEVEITAYSASGRVDEIKIGSVVMTGTGFRELLSLRSTNLELNFPDQKTVEIISKGYGHGVGMSQCGADAMGRKGLDYIRILEYYYTGIKVEEITY